MNKSLLNYFTKIAIFTLLLASVNFANAQVPTFVFSGNNTSPQPENVALGDFDGDGKVDVANTSASTNVISVLRNTSSPGGTPFLGARINFVGINNPHYVACGDLDGDGKLDLVVSNDNGLSLSVFRNISSGPGNINFAARVDISTGENPRTIVIVDLDGDGKPEIANTNGGSSGNNVSVFRNTCTSGTISFAARVNFACQTQPWGLASGDLDGDGKNDLAVGGYTSDVMSVFRNTSSGIGNINFDTRADYATGVSTQPINLAIEDVDGDGKAEVVTPNYGAASVSLFPNTSTIGTISFASKIDFTVGLNPFEVTITDLNADGKKEIITANIGANKISVLENTGSTGVFTFNAKVDFNTIGTAPQGLNHADMNNDGKEDIVVACNGTGSISIFGNTTSLVPVNPTITLGSNPKVCFGSTSANLSYSATSTPNQYSIDFDAAAETAGFVDVTLTALPVSPISIVVPGGAALGTYNATITVKNTTSGLSSAGNAFTIIVSGIPTGSAAVTSAITCNNLTDGSITVTPSGGSGSGYTYKEVGGSYQAGALFTGLANGSHSFVVKDSYGCESTTTISSSLSNPTIVSITSATKLSYNGSDLTCFGQSDGQITVVATGGTGALEYSKDNGGVFQTPSNIFSGLGENPYTIIVKDANGCLSTSTVVTINQTPVIVGTASNNGPICAGTTLSLSGNISGGTGALTYSWVGVNGYISDTSNTTARTVSTNATVAMGGLYSLLATDVNGCSYNVSTNAVVNSIPTASISGTTTLCKDAASPFVTFIGANGVAPYTFTYKINGGSNIVSPASVVNSIDVLVPTGTAGTFVYTLVSVQDASSSTCTGSASGSATVIVKPKPILISNASPVTNTICEGNATTITCTNGSLSLNPIVTGTAYTNNFNSAIGSNWTFPSIVPANVPELKNYNGGSVLGYLSNQQAVFNLNSMPAHNEITIDFDLFIHDTWDGNSPVSGPDMWSMKVDGVTKINTTFSNATWLSNDQSYPNDFAASNLSFAGAAQTGLPTACNLAGGSLSARYHITKTITHSASSMNLILEAMGLENVCNESWSIDNFTVNYSSQTSSSNIAWTNPAVNSNSIIVSPIVNTYYVATLNGCSDSIEIIVNPTPRADFTISNDTQCITSNSFDFTNGSTLAGPGGMTYAWTMAGATTTSSALQDIVANSYATFGNYNVSLVATSVIGNCNDYRGNITKPISVSAPVAISVTPASTICLGSTVRLTANQVTGSGSSLVYSSTYNNNFETSIGSAWTFPAVVPANVPDMIAFDGTKILGKLGNQQAIYNQTGLPAHQFVKIEFDLYLHDTWDGNSSVSGPDVWKMNVDGNSLINTTFSNLTWLSADQAYPNNVPASNPGYTGALSSSLPALCNLGGGSPTSKYHISRTIAHTGSSLNMILEAMGLEDVCNESWSIDNFDIQLGANTVTQTLVSACTGLGGGGGGSGPVVYTLNQSNNFNTSIGSAWTFPAVVPANDPTIKSFNGESIMGTLGNQQAVYNQTGLGAHEFVKVEFDLYLHDTWDGNSPVSGPDVWKMDVDGNSIINTTFSNLTWLSADQAYPNNMPASNPGYTGALSSSLPAICNLGGGSPTSKYRISKIIPHTSNTLNLVLEAMGLENVCNESWSIDNFELSLGTSSGGGTVLPLSSATWSGGAVTGQTTCYVDVTPTSNTDYTVTIGACTSPITTITVLPIPAPAFTLDNGNCTKTVSFNNTNIEPSVIYTWSFGDGTADFIGNVAPAHTYTNGTYTITLLAGYASGCSRTVTQTITIVDRPTASILSSGGVGCNSTVQFTSNSTIPSGSTPTYLWNFGETPVPNTSALQNPDNTYLLNGTYSVQLIVSTSVACKDTATTSIVINVSPSANQSIFTATVSGSCGNMVTTTNSSTGVGNQYLWNFGDGSTSNDFAPTHYYTDGGLKTITLSILNVVGCASSSSKVVSISNNSGANGRVGLQLNVTTNSPVLLTNSFDFDITILDNGLNNPGLYAAGLPTWTYGDGTGSNATDVFAQHYNSVGTYTIRFVQQTTNTGCFAEISSTVTVLPNPPYLQVQRGSLNANEQKMDNNAASTSIGKNTNEKKADFSVYPNPNFGDFKVQINNLYEHNGDLAIIDMLGREVYKTSYNTKSNNDIINVNGFNVLPGTYFVVLSNKGVIQARKMFVVNTAQ